MFVCGLGLLGVLIWQAATPARKEADRLTVVAPSPIVPVPATDRDPVTLRPSAPEPRLELPYARATARLREEPEAVPETPAEPEPKRFFRVIVSDAGTLGSGALKIRLNGLQALALDAQCDQASKPWPCGRAGRAALRRLIRGRAVLCTDLAPLGENEFAGRCSVAGVDISQWLVRYGWAHPSAGTERFDDALEAAQREKRGQWKRMRDSDPT